MGNKEMFAEGANMLTDEVLELAATKSRETLIRILVNTGMRKKKLVKYSKDELLRKIREVLDKARDETIELMEEGKIVEREWYIKSVKTNMECIHRKYVSETKSLCYHAEGNVECLKEWCPKRYEK